MYQCRTANSRSTLTRWSMLPSCLLAKPPQERISERIQIVDMPVLQILEEPVVPQHQEEIVKVITALFTAERTSERTVVEQIVDVPVPNFREDQ